MIPVASLDGRKVALFGLGSSGRATAAALVAGGAEVAAWDDDATAVASAAVEGLPVADLHNLDWSGFAALVLAPGVPLTHPAPHWTVEMARGAGVEVIGDIELFCRERRRAPAGPFVAVTGTNGKSTTSALIAHLLASGALGGDPKSVQLGGNIGTPILALAPPRPGRIHVIEISSFQIDLAPSLDPSIGVLLNVRPDHLDRHGNFARYAAIKARLAAVSKLAVIAVDDEVSTVIAERRERAGLRTVRVSAGQRLADGIFADGPVLFEARGGSAEAVASLAGLGALRGKHNAQNAVAAAAAGRQLGLDWREITAALATFRGLPHRMEEVGRRGRVVFVNDSKATNADAAATALASFDRIYWIAGGRPKEGGIAALESFFGKIAKAYLIGEAAAEFSATLAGRVPYEIAGTLAGAVAAAARDSAVDDAPKLGRAAFAGLRILRSVQEFRAARDEFRALARALEGVESRGRAA